MGLRVETESIPQTGRTRRTIFAGTFILTQVHVSNVCLAAQQGKSTVVAKVDGQEFVLTTLESKLKEHANLDLYFRADQVWRGGLILLRVVLFFYVGKNVGAIIVIWFDDF